jgi:hypothetical protein
MSESSQTVARTAWASVRRKSSGSMGVPLWTVVLTWDIGGGHDQQIR